MKLAIQEAALPGETILQKLQHAQSLGLAGVEFTAEDLQKRIPEILGAMETTGVQASGVYAGITRILHPTFKERDSAIAALRTSMTGALDIGAAGVVFIPHYSTSPVMPDLRPYKSAEQLEGEMLIAQLRGTLVDLAYALGAQLYMLAVSQQRAYLINTLEQAHIVLDKIDSPPQLKIAVDTSDMYQTEESMVTVLGDYIGDIGYVHLADTAHRLPGHGELDLNAALGALKGYNGWVTLASRVPNVNDPTYLDDLRHSLALLRGAMA